MNPTLQQCKIHGRMAPTTRYPADLPQAQRPIVGPTAVTALLAAAIFEAETFVDNGPSGNGNINSSR